MSVRRNWPDHIDEFWLPPTDGQKIVDWCNRKDAELSKETNDGR